MFAPKDTTILEYADDFGGSLAVADDVEENVPLAGDGGSPHPLHVAFEAAGVPMEAPGASRALGFVIAANVELRRLETPPWWRKRTAKRRMADILDAFNGEVHALAETPPGHRPNIGLEFA